MEHPPLSIAKALEKVDQVVARLQQLQSTIAVTRQAVVSGGCSPKGRNVLESTPRRLKLENAAARYDERTTNSSTAGEWKQWSAPAEIVYEALSEILTAARHAKELTGGVAQVLQVQNIESRQNAEEMDVEDGYTDDDEQADKAVEIVNKCERKGRETKMVGNAKKKSQLLDEVELSKFVTKPCIPPTQSMKVSKVRQSQKTWKLSQIKSAKSKGAVMFPNLAYSPSSPPQSSKNFRILPPFKNPSSRRNIGGALANRAVDKAQKAPLLGKKKRQGSPPVKSLPTLIDRLPSKNRGAILKRPAGIAGTSTLSRSKEQLPYPPSHYSQADKSSSTRSQSKKNAGGRNATATSPQPFKVLEGNAAASRKSDRDVAAKRSAEQHSGRAIDEKTSFARARSISPRRKHSDKENLLNNSTASMRRSWSASSASFSAKNNLAGGHSMLQRAKGWMLGKQHAKGTRF